MGWVELAQPKTVGIFGCKCLQSYIVYLPTKWKAYLVWKKKVFVEKPYSLGYDKIGSLG